MSKAFTAVQDQLNQKASIEALQDLEQRILDKMNELFSALMGKFVDKAEFKKALLHLDQQLKSLYDMIMSNGGGKVGHEEDAMFAKRPLGGWSCASCEKGLINLEGRAADFLPWSKLPFRDPSERLSRVQITNYFFK